MKKILSYEKDYFTQYSGIQYTFHDTKDMIRTYVIFLIEFFFWTNTVLYHEVSGASLMRQKPTQRTNKNLQEYTLGNLIN